METEPKGSVKIKKRSSRREIAKCEADSLTIW